MKHRSDTVRIRALEDDARGSMRRLKYLFFATFLCLVLGVLAGILALGLDLSSLPGNTQHARLPIFAASVAVFANVGLVVLLALLVHIVRRLHQREEMTREKARQLELAAVRMFNSQEQEKKLVAWKLHEGTVQALVAIKTRVELACRHDSLEGGSGVAERLSTILPIIQDTIDDVRAIATDLRPSSLDDLGVIPTLKWLCGRFESLYPNLLLQAQIEILEQHIPRNVKISIFRVAQEALYSLAPNAANGAVHLVLRGDKDSIDLLIESSAMDPVQHATDPPQTAPFAFSALRERVIQTGGKFLLERAGDKGTRLQIRASWRTADERRPRPPVMGKASGSDISP